MALLQELFIQLHILIYFYSTIYLGQTQTFLAINQDFSFVIVCYTCSTAL